MSRDAWLGGRRTLVQPRRGHRAGTDAALLAAAADFSAGQLVDVGAGVGAVALAILSRCPGASADFVEIDRELAAQAEDNARCNGLAGTRGSFSSMSATPAPDGLRNSPTQRPRPSSPTRLSSTPGRFVCRPTRPGRSLTSLAATRAAPLFAWICACLALLKPGGCFVMIHRPDALTAILAAAEDRLGALALLPVHPRAGVSARRLLVWGRRARRPAPDRAWPRPAWGRRPDDRAGGRDPPRRGADRLGRLAMAEAPGRL